jgi:hypothetical protein
MFRFTDRLAAWLKENDMLKRMKMLCLGIAVCMLGASAQAQNPCPGYNAKHNVNLACEIATETRTSGIGSSLSDLGPTVASELTNLPIATAVTGSGIAFSKALGVFTASTDSLGTILTQRGETIGRHNFLASFTYQRFSFDTLDGISLSSFPTVNQYVDPKTGNVSYTQAVSDIKLNIDQYTALASFGLTNRIDASLIVPFSRVILDTNSQVRQYVAYSSGSLGVVNAPSQPLYGSASGIGDVTLNLKANVYKGEHTSIALGNDIRFKTGDPYNYLGSGATGLKPYLVYSRRGRITPNVNVGYQWSGRSVLYPSPASGADLRLPSIFLFSFGADARVVPRFTLVSEFLGQWVLNGPRVALAPSPVAALGGVANTVLPVVDSYAIRTANVGVKVNPYKRLYADASMMIELDDAGLRNRVQPLVGIAYRF